MRHSLSTALSTRVRKRRHSSGERARRTWLRWKLFGFTAMGAMRRVLDIVCAALGLMAIAPILAAAAVAIKSTSRGPVFYKQERLGYHGRRFHLWKLRTMVQNAEALKAALIAAHADSTDGVRFKMRRDPRITAVGRILRKFSIDELPQLFNVLIGDMTIVGPRPPVWREVALYSPRALRRLQVKPGLTCLWQISGRSDIPFEQQVELDLHYIDTVKPLEEVGIIARTIPAVLSGRGAY